MGREEASGKSKTKSLEAIFGARDTAAEIQRDAEMAMQNRYPSPPEVKKLSTRAKGIPVFPSTIKGTARSMTTTTAKDDICAFFFGQEELMAGMGQQGAKISSINPD